jgi:abortive infection bacteriophage resistance protein
MLYDKPPISIDQQIEKLKERGLHFDSEAKAKKYLSHIS